MHDDIIYQHDKLKYNKATTNRHPGIIYTNTLPDSIFVSISLITTSKIINAYVDDILVASISAIRSAGYFSSAFTVSASL